MTLLALSHTHRFDEGDRERPPLLLLRGTGGDENDLLPLGRMVAPGASLLSPRGQVAENGMPRFFRRMSEGMFDHADVRARADALADFVEEARAAYGLPAPIALGFSNGANIAAAILYRRPDAFAGAILVRAMVPLPEAPAVALSGKPILILSGSADPIIPPENSAALAETLISAGGDVTHRVLPAGHGLTPSDVQLAAEWLTLR